uniref:Flavodoxin-like domain-containing protein n=1 Tax=Xiphophorus couchianus TaxID=32473 RepID=A0A3B5LPT7_9TELE
RSVIGQETAIGAPLILTLYFIYLCFILCCVSKSVCVFLVATYSDGRPTKNAEWFCKWLEEASTDFRYGNSFLKGLRYAVFGLGDSVYVGHYNTVGKNVDKWLWMLSAKRVLSRGEGDGNVVKSRHGSVQADFRAWEVRFLSRLKALARGEKKSCSGNCKSGASCKNRKKHGAQEEEENGSEKNKRFFFLFQVELIESSSEEEESGLSGEKMSRSVVDMEDLGNIMNNVKRAKVRFHPRSKRLFELHMLEKMCDQVKSFFSILLKLLLLLVSRFVSNRHHTNPVGTEWRWKMDPAEKILQDSLEKHQNMIRQFRGVPGVKPERYEEGLAAKHCALSLVGEPIMYPEINTFLRLLHSHHISSFLVTNAQFPEEIRNLVPVTQLYVSVDASTKDSLKKIDRPLFKDFWPRFLDCLRALGEKKQRTVYRLTLVKAWNVEELQAYAELIALGQPDFIEVKRLFPTGVSSQASLTMQQVGFIFSSNFKVNGEWWTWIDYDRFQDLVQAHEDSGGQQSFSALDYTAKTPSWALFGSNEQGFDPADTRFQRRNKTKDISGC